MAAPFGVWLRGPVSSSKKKQKLLSEEFLQSLPQQMLSHQQSHPISVSSTARVTNFSMTPSKLSISGKAFVDMSPLAHSLNLADSFWSYHSIRQEDELLMAEKREIEELVETEAELFSPFCTEMEMNLQIPLAESILDDYMTIPL